jgi:hypothetical protein
MTWQTTLPGFSSHETPASRNGAAFKDKRNADFRGNLMPPTCENN